MAISLGNTSEVALDALCDEVLATAAMEGEQLSLDVVRPSVMRRLGLAASGPARDGGPGAPVRRPACRRLRAVAGAA